MGTIERFDDSTYPLIPRERLSPQQHAWLDAEKAGADTEQAMEYVGTALRNDDVGSGVKCELVRTLAENATPKQLQAMARAFVRRCEPPALAVAAKIRTFPGSRKE